MRRRSSLRRHRTRSVIYILSSLSSPLRLSPLAANSSFQHHQTVDPRLETILQSFGAEIQALCQSSHEAEKDCEQARRTATPAPAASKPAPKLRALLAEDVSDTLCVSSPGSCEQLTAVAHRPPTPDARSYCVLSSS
ncbi:unnamed protein product [Diplocarpon coronariae]